MEEEEMVGSRVKFVIQISSSVPISSWNPMHLELVNIYFSTSGGPA